MSVPGLSLVEDWIDDAAERALLARIDAEPWRADLKRRVQHYGYRYDYKARKADASMRLGPLPEWALALATRIVDEGRCEATPDQVIANEYQPGQGISRHVDCVPCFGPTVLSLSLGSTCTMDLACRDERASIVIRPRSLLVLTGASRSEWSHAIAARKSDVIGGVSVPRERRVSLTFRTVRLS